MCEKYRENSPSPRISTSTQLNFHPVLHPNKKKIKKSLFWENNKQENEKSRRIIYQYFTQFQRG